MTQPSIDSIAPISRRAIAYLIDALISGAIGVAGVVIVTIVALLPRPTEELLIVMPIAYGVLSLVLLGWFVLYTIMQTRGGSIGMRAQRLRLASAVDGGPIGFGRALLRNVVFGLSTSIVVGYFTPLFDGSGRFQGWHDKVGNAVVVDAKISPVPIRRPEAGAPGSAAPVQAAPVSAPPVPLLPPAPLAGGYGAAPVPAPPGFPSQAGVPAGHAASGYAASQPGSGSMFAAPADQAATPGAPAFLGAPPVSGAPSFSGAPAFPGASSSPVVPPVPTSFPTPTPASGAPSAFSVPTDGSSFAVPPLPPHPGAAPQHPSAPVHPEGFAQQPVAAPQQAAPQPAVPLQGAPGFGTPATPAPAFGGPTAPAFGTPSAPAGGVDSLIAFVPGVTPASAPVPAASAPATPVAPAAAQGIAPFVPGAPVGPVEDALAEEDVFGETIIQPRATKAQEDAELESTRISIPGHRLLFTWDDGTRVTVSRRTIFGRNPAHEDGTERVAVRDETLSLSKTHFEAASEVSGGWVLDRHSTNGMTIVRDGERIDCPPGQRVPVRLGDAIEIGDRIVTIGGYV